MNHRGFWPPMEKLSPASYNLGSKRGGWAFSSTDKVLASLLMEAKTNGARLSHSLSRLCRAADVSLARQVAGTCHCPAGITCRWSAQAAW